MLMIHYYNTPNSANWKHPQRLSWDQCVFGGLVIHPHLGDPTQGDHSANPCPGSALRYASRLLKQSHLEAFFFFSPFQDVFGDSSSVH